MSRIRTVVQWVAFWLLWVMVCVAGLLVDRVLFRGTFIASGIVKVVETWIGSDVFSLRVSEILTSGVLGLVDGLLLGMFQWVAIRRLIKGALGWILASSLGLSVGLMTFWSLLVLTISGRLPVGSDYDWAFGIGMIDAVVTGIVLGFAQYLVLRRKLRKSEWWVPTMIVTMVAMWIIRWFVSPGASFFVFGAVSGIVITILGALSAVPDTEVPSGFSPADLPIPASQRET